MLPMTPRMTRIGGMIVGSIERRRRIGSTSSGLKGATRGQSTALTPRMTMNDPLSSSPGMTPAMNSRPIEVSVITP